MGAVLHSSAGEKAKAKLAGSADSIEGMLTSPSQPVAAPHAEVVSSDGDREEDDDKLQDEPGPEHQIQWTFGWDPRVKKPYRHPVDRPASKEYTDDVEPAECQLAPPVASWKDGVQWQVSSIISADLPPCGSPPEAIVVPESRVSPAADQMPCTQPIAATELPPNVHWSGTTAERWPCVVKDRFDKGRPQLVVIFLSNKQVCQCPVSDVGHARAVETMKTLAQRLCEGTIERGQLLKERNTIMGMSPTARWSSKALLKRPAAGPVEAPAAKAQASTPATSSGNTWDLQQLGEMRGMFDIDIFRHR